MNYIVLCSHHGAFITADSIINTHKSIFHPGAGHTLMLLVNLLKANKYLNEPLTSIDSDFVGAFRTRYPKAKVIEVESTDFSSPADLFQFISGPTMVMQAGCVLNSPIESIPEVAGSSVAACSPFVYKDNKRLSMYHMIGIKTHSSNDYSSFYVDPNGSGNYAKLPRRYNNKSDTLIGTAISARETLLHGAAALKAPVLNYWGDVIRPYERQEPEQTFAYPYEVYAKYAKQLSGFIPETTRQRIIENGDRAEYWKPLRAWLASTIEAK